jgi:hypothetical protein
MRIVPTTMHANQQPHVDPAAAKRRPGRPLHETERSIPTVMESSARAIGPAARPRPVEAPRAPTAPRWIEAERDYHAPTPIERARLLRAAYEASVADPEQRLLIAELMAHYRAWCLRHGKGDPFAGLSRG